MHTIHILTFLAGNTTYQTNFLVRSTIVLFVSSAFIFYVFVGLFSGRLIVLS